MCSKSDDYSVKLIDGITYYNNSFMTPINLSESKQFSLKLEQAYGKEFESDELLGMVKFITTDTNDNVYIFDSMNMKLLKYNVDGELLWSVGSKGQGPGDFGWVNGLVFDGIEKLYISNFRGTRIDIYNLDGMFLESVLVELFNIKKLKLVGVFSGKYILGISSPRKMESYTIHKSIIYIFEFKDGLSLVNSFAFNEELNFEVPIGMQISPQVSICDSLIAVTSLDDFSIWYFNIYGELIRKLSKDSPFVTRTCFYVEGDRHMMAGLGVLQAPILLKNNFELIWSFSTEGVNDPDLFMKKRAEGKGSKLTFINMIDVFTPESKLVSSIIGKSRFPDFGWPITVDQKGFLYTYNENPFPRVLKYKIMIN